MSTRHVTPRADFEGQLGEAGFNWGEAFIGTLHIGNTLPRADAAGILNGDTPTADQLAAFLTGEDLLAINDSVAAIKEAVESAVQTVQQSEQEIKDAKDLSVLAKMDAETARDQVREWLDQAAAAAIAADDALKALQRDKQQLQDELAAALDNTRKLQNDLADMRELLAEHDVAQVELKTTTIEPDDWEPIDPAPTEGHMYYYDVSINECTPDMYPRVDVTPETIGVAQAAGMDEAETVEGAVRLYADTVPTGDVDITVSVLGNLTVLPIPLPRGGLTYDGTELSPSWAGYNAIRMTMGGTTSATDAGTYTATFELTGNRKWTDNTKETKSVDWVINKAEPRLSLDTGLTTLAVAGTAVVNVNRDGDGAITATPDDSAIATVTVSGTEITVTGVAVGTATVSVSLAEGTNYQASANDVTFDVEVNEA